jgi:hypothetical protein
MSSCASTPVNLWRIIPRCLELTFLAMSLYIVNREKKQRHATRKKACAPPEGKNMDLSLVYLGTIVCNFGDTLGSLWGHFGITLGPLWGHFGVTLASLWGHLGVPQAFSRLYCVMCFCKAVLCDVLLSRNQTEPLQKGSMPGDQKIMYCVMCFCVFRS